MTSFLPHAAGERDRVAALGRRLAVPGRRVAEPDPAGDGGALAGAGVNLAGTTERRQPVRHVPQPRTRGRGGWVEAGADVGDREQDLPAVLGQADPYRRPGACLVAFWSASTQQK